MQFKKVCLPLLLSLCPVLGLFVLGCQDIALAQNRAPGYNAPALQPFSWKDVNGSSYDLEALRGNKATVFLFLSTQCPISNIYTTRINELVSAYNAKGVQFFLINANPLDTLETIRQDAKERKFTAPVVRDEGLHIADQLDANRTPEAIIVDSNLVVRYRGRIDDNPDRSRVIRQDLRYALNLTLEGKSIPTDRARNIPQGCFIFRESKNSSTTEGKETVTYTRDVARILNKNCVTCHRKGDAAPFPLDSYQQARLWASTIKDYTERRLMPPWKAVPGFGDFHDSRRMAEADIATLAKWAETGAAKGDPKDLPAKPPFPSLNGWSLGKPDVVLKPSAPYKLGAEGNDVYRCYVLPLEAAQDLYIRGVEIKPGNRAVVHHMILFVDMTGESVTMDKRDPGPGYSVTGTGIGIPFSKELYIAGWVPGTTQRFLPKGAAFQFPKGAKAVLQVHYHRNGKESLDQSQVALWFEKKQNVQSVIYTNAMAYPYLSLKPGSNNEYIKDSTLLRHNVRLWAVLPHMHMLGREFRMTATLPNGTKIPLVYINDWDFNWQETYRYKKPIDLPKGTKIDMYARFDNSEKNPRQPSHPPKRVTWGEQTTDEMCIGFFQLSVLGPDAKKGNPREGTESAFLFPRTQMASARK